MDISYNWLQDYIDDELPEPPAVARVLTRGAYEVESSEMVSDDVVFDVDVLPNRASDSLGHIGVARELAVLANLSFSAPEPEVEGKASQSSQEKIQLSVGTDKCRRALKRLAVEVEVGESPDWLKTRLETLGQKSINNIVDITNLLMLETGQPVHAFDYDKLTGESPKNVTIRPAKEGETVTTLDGDTYELDEEMLVIADDEKPLDIAGIKGGQASGIDENTTRVMLSVCSFDPTTIRKTSQKLNLRTDASKRFENNVPPAMSAWSLERFSELISKVAGGRVTEDVCDVYSRLKNSYKAGVTIEQINNLLGIEVAEEEAVDILKQLGCKVETVTPRDFVVQEAETYTGMPYKYGAGVLRDAPNSFDCSSFTSWLYVQGGIGLPRITVDQFAYTKEITKDELQAGDLIFSNTKKDEGGEIYYETQEFMPGTEVPDGVDHCGIYLADGKVIHVSRHNHGEDGGVEVEDLETAKQFQNITKFGRIPEADKKHIVATVPAWRPDLRRSQDLIEEVARVYGYDNISGTLPEAPEASQEDNSVRAIRRLLSSWGFTEVKTYSLIADGDIEIANPVAEDKAYLRTTLRDNLAAVQEKNQTHLPVLEADALRVFEIGRVFSADQESLEVGVAVDGDNAEDEIDGIFTELSDFIGAELTAEIQDSVGTAELPDVESLEVTDNQPAEEQTFPVVDFQTPSAYPYVLRDVAVWTPAGTSQEEVGEIITAAASDLLVACNHFDTYEKDDQISYAFKLVFQSSEKTLNDEEVNEQMQAVTESLENQDGFKVR